MIERKKNISVAGSHQKPILFDLFYKKTNSPKPLVIFSHGFKGFKDWGPFNLIAEKFAEENFVFAKLNFSWNGVTPGDLLYHGDLEAFGKNTFTKELDDLEIVLNTILADKDMKNETDFSGIHLIGHSRGGGISILKAREDARIKKVAAWASVIDFGKYLNQHGTESWKEEGVVYVQNARTQQQMPLYYSLYEDYYQNKKRLDIKEALAELNQPLIIFHGTEDDSVPFEDAIEMKRLSKNSTLVKFVGGNHTFGAIHPFEGNKLPEDFDLVVRETIRFLKIDSV